MRQSNSQNAIEWLLSVIPLARPADRFVVSVPSSRHVRALLRQITTPGEALRTGLLISAIPDLPPSAKRGFSYLLTEDTWTARTLLQRIRARIKKTPSRIPVIVDCSCLLGHPRGRPQQLRAILAQVWQLLAKRRSPSIWFIPRDLLPDSEIVRIKDESALYVDITQHGPLFVAQFLSARGISNQEFFSPRIISLSDSAVSGTHPQPEVPEGSASPSLLPDVAGVLQTKYREVFETANDGIAVFDLDGTYRDVNPRGCEILGYQKPDVQNVPLSELVSAASYRTALRLLVTLKKKGKVAGQLNIKRRTGRSIWVSVNVSSLPDRNCVVVFRDVTQSRAHEEEIRRSEAQYRAFVEGAPYPMAVFVHKRLVLYNRAFQRFFSISDGDHTVPITLADLLGKENAPFLRELAALEREDSVTADVHKKEIRFTPVKPDRTAAVPEPVTVSGAGSEGIDLEVSYGRVIFGGKKALQCSFIDISGRKRLIRQLEESETKYKLLIESSIDAVSVAQDETFVFANKGFLDMFGYSSPEEVIGKEISLVVAGKDRDLVLARSRRRRSGEVVPNRYEYTGVRKGGTELTIEVQEGTMMMGGKTTALAYHRDITERRQAEEQLRQKMRALEILDQISIAVSQSIQLEDVLRIGLRESMRCLNYDLGAVYSLDKEGTGLTMVQHHGLTDQVVHALRTQNTSEGITGYVAKTQEPLVLSISEYPSYLPYKSLFQSEKITTVVYVPLTARGSLTGIMMVATSRRKGLAPYEREFFSSVGSLVGAALENALLYAQLKESEERYRNAVENISDVIYQARPDGSLLFISPNVVRLLGHRAQDFYGSADLWRSAIHPDDRATYGRRIGNQDQGKDDFHLTYRMLPKGKASYRWIRDSVRYIRDQDGRVSSVNGIVSDISDRMELEGALLKSEELKANVLQSLQEGVVVYDKDFRCLDWNTAMEELTGVRREQVVGRNAFEDAQQSALPEIRQLLERALKGEPVRSEDIPFKFPGGDEDRFIWARYSPLRDREGMIQGVVGIVSDVSHRHLLEREVRESEETLRNVIDAMGDALMISDLQGRVWEVNREFSRLTGYPRSEVLGATFPYAWLLDEEMAKFVLWIAALREKNYLRDFDMTWRRKDGHSVAISLNTTLLRNAVGEPMAMLNIARDISDRKRLSVELERKNKHIELLNRIISKANTTVEFDRIFDTIGEEVFHLVSYDRISIALVTEDRTSVSIYACAGPAGKRMPAGKSVDFERTVSKAAATRGKAIVINTPEECRNLGLDESVSREFRSHISIPIFSNERLLGTFDISARKEEAFTGEELAFLQPLTDQIGAMIDRVRLFQKVSDDSKYIRDLLNSIDSVVFTVDRQYRITAVNQAWREFAIGQGLRELAEEGSVLGHNLKDVIPEEDRWRVYERVMKELFEGKVDYYSQEFELSTNGDHKTFHLAINPMVINATVTGLVFTNTDITEIKQTESEIKRRNKELVALNTISTSISTSLNLDEVLRVASEQIQDVVGADIVLLYLREEPMNQLRLARFAGLPEELATPIRLLDVAASVTGRVVESRQPLHIRKAARDDDRVSQEGRDIFRKLGVDSLGVIPLQSKDRVLGALDIAFTAEHEFTEQEQQLLTLIGNQLGAAIENAQLYEEVRAQVKRITSLYELGKGLTGALDVRSLLETVGVGVRSVLPLDRLEYASFSEERCALVPVFEIRDGKQKFYEEGSRKSAPPLDPDSILWKVVTNSVSYRGSVEDESVLIVPVKSKQKVMGVLSIRTKGTDAYSDTHLRLLESIANLTEIAIEKALLYEDTVSKSREIEKRNKELDDFTYVVSHDLKEPLISIEGYSKILLNDYGDRIDQEGKEFLGTVVQSTSRMKSLIDDLLTLSRLGRMSESLQTINVTELVREILNDLQFTLKEKHVTVRVPETLPEVRYSATQLSMVFVNLISNSVKFNDKPAPTIDIGVQEEETQYVFSVSDNGIGIDERYFERVFMIFQRLQRSEEYRGTGAGLTIVKKIIENHNGRIWVKSEPGKGTTFFFTIPKV